MRGLRTGIQDHLLTWFAKHKRDLPWRVLTAHGRRDPYRVWLAEVMLQQTQVVTAMPYFARWLERFPTLRALADAPLDDVLKQWEGLGYYARARNFHKAVQTVVRDYNGELPHTVEELLKLPGIGRYTAGAVASLAFDQDAPVLDGNVKRVLSRLFAIGPDKAWTQRIDSATLRDNLAEEKNEIEALWQLSTWLLPKGQAGAFNEALMDLGATICTPRAPDCPHCPVQKHCAAYAQGKPEGYPLKKAARATPHKHFGTAVLVDGQGQMLMGQRPTNGLLGGLWEFISGELSEAAQRDAGLPLFGTSLAGELAQIVQARTGLSVEVSDADFIGTVQHGFTHFTMTKHVALVRVNETSAPLRSDDYTQLRWVTAEEAAALALTRSDQKILAMVEKRPRGPFAADGADPQGLR